MAQPPPLPPPPQKNQQQGQIARTAAPPPSGSPVVMVVGEPQLTEYPCEITCSSCNKRIVTQTLFVKGTFTWLMVLLLLLVGGIICLCFIPFCCEGCQDVEHRCPNCGNLIGVFKRMK